MTHDRVICFRQVNKITKVSLLFRSHLRQIFAATQLRDNAATKERFRTSLYEGYERNVREIFRWSRRRPTIDSHVNVDLVQINPYWCLLNESKHIILSISYNIVLSPYCTLVASFLMFQTVNYAILKKRSCLN